MRRVVALVVPKAEKMIAEKMYPKVRKIESAITRAMICLSPNLISTSRKAVNASRVLERADAGCLNRECERKCTDLDGNQQQGHGKEGNKVSYVHGRLQV
jgi:hypothetical protein